MHVLAKAINNLTRERHGEYKKVVRPKRSGVPSPPTADKPKRLAVRETGPEYDVSVVSARALNPVVTPSINAALAEAVRAGRTSRIEVVDTVDNAPLPADWQPSIAEDEMVLVSAPFPPDVRQGHGVVLLIVQKPPTEPSAKSA